MSIPEFCYTNLLNSTGDLNLEQLFDIFAHSGILTNADRLAPGPRSAYRRIESRVKLLMADGDWWILKAMALS